MHPSITAAVAEEHRRDMIAQAEAHRIARIARAARASRPALARPMRVIPRLFAAACRSAARLLPVKAAVEGRGQLTLASTPPAGARARRRGAG